MLPIRCRGGVPLGSWTHRSPQVIILMNIWHLVKLYNKQKPCFIFNFRIYVSLSFLLSLHTTKLQIRLVLVTNIQNPLRVWWRINLIQSDQFVTKMARYVRQKFKSYIQTDWQSIASTTWPNPQLCYLQAFGQRWRDADGRWRGGGHGARNVHGRHGSNSALPPMEPSAPFASLFGKSTECSLRTLIIVYTIYCIESKTC